MVLHLCFRAVTQPHLYTTLLILSWLTCKRYRLRTYRQRHDPPCLQRWMGFWFAHSRVAPRNGHGLYGDVDLLPRPPQPPTGQYCTGGLSRLTYPNGLGMLSRTKDGFGSPLLWRRAFTCVGSPHYRRTSLLWVNSPSQKTSFKYWITSVDHHAWGCSYLV